MDVRLKRVYEPANRSDGYRILIDRLWPRGVSRSEQRWTHGNLSWRRAPSCGRGSDTIRVASRSSVGATQMSFAGNVRVSRSSGGGPATARSRSCSPLEIRNITTRSSSLRSCAEGCHSSVARRNPPPLTWPISVNPPKSLTTRRRSSGCIVSMSMMSAQSSPCPSRYGAQADGTRTRCPHLVHETPMPGERPTQRWTATCSGHAESRTHRYPFTQAFADPCVSRLTSTAPWIVAPP